MKKFKFFIALDLKSNTQNISIVKKMYHHVYGFKVGYRSFYNKRSDELISEIKKKKSKLFLDLKLHDIPNTVKRAINVICDYGIWMTNVHVLGGKEMLASAKQVVKKESPETKLKQPSEMEGSNKRSSGSGVQLSNGP